MNLTGRTAIVMSRLPRLIEPQEPWLAGLRAAMRWLKRDGGTLVSVDQTAGAEFVRRGAVRLGIDVERIDSESLARSEGSADDAIPQRDQLLVTSAETVIALGLRTNGNVHQLLRERLISCGDVGLVDLPGLHPKAVRDELLSLGATCWKPETHDQRPFEICAEPSEAFPGPVRSNDVCEIVPFPESNDWMFLSHTTRACSGPWPGQAVEDYLDSLLDASPDADHSPVATLMRIVRQRRLIASGRVIRCGFPVVCLTAVPLVELPALRKFQTHRSRWDFEPFGICIRRDWLQRQGARPVVYGDEEVWNALPESDRPWFQLSGEGNSEDGSNGATDWSIEREWRHRGDLDLQGLPAEAALVFVPNFAAAQRVSVVSPWPVTLWPGEYEVLG